VEWGEDLMHHLINNGSMADGAYTYEQGETIITEEDEVEQVIRITPMIL
jgi:hypothetical protein